MPVAPDHEAPVPSGERPAPFIVRIGGLPAETMQAFSSKALMEGVQSCLRLQERLDLHRTALADLLQAAIRNAPREQRGALLSVKRDCFNARSLGKHQDTPQWIVLNELAGGLGERIVDLEQSLELIQRQLQAQYRQEEHREWSELSALLANRAFMRGVTLASPEFARSLSRLQGKTPGSFDRKDKRLASSLLRYASRAAVKLSPFSSFTRIGVGVIVDEGSPGFELVKPGQWQERPTVRLRRELLDQCLCLLLRSRKLAENLQVQLNDTVKSLGEDRYSFFRPGHWELDEDTRTFNHREEALVRVKIEGDLIPQLVEQLSNGPELYSSLVRKLTPAGEPPLQVEEEIRGLLDLGFLHFVLPWEANDPDLETQILDYVRTLAGDAAVGELSDAMSQLLDALARHPAADVPLRSVEECGRRVERLFRAALPLSDFASSFNFKTRNLTFEEDVFLNGDTNEAGIPAVARMSRRRAEELLQDLDPLIRVSNLDSSRHDFLYSFAAFAGERWPGRQEVELLDLYGIVLPLLKSYLQYKHRLRRQPLLRASGFNPFDLVRVKKLIRERRFIADNLSSVLSRDHGVCRLCPHGLDALLDQVPEAYAATRDFCAFVQPLDPAGRMWVLNDIFDGYGRLGSRYTSAMDDSTRDYWTDFFLQRSYPEVQGERVELVDISGSDFRTINVHAIQTYRCLRMPGEASRLIPERLLRLKDLRVRFQGEDAPRLTDAAGRRLLPVHLGGLSPLFRPTILKFLGLLGPTDLPTLRPVLTNPRSTPMDTIDRHVIGSMVYLRRYWELNPQDFPSLHSGEGQGVMTSMNRWRLANGLPDQVYVSERLAADSDRIKPQYIDFSSPSFIHILDSIFRKSHAPVTLVEALPSPEQYLGEESSWAIELQLESFGIRDESDRNTESPVRNEGS